LPSSLHCEHAADASLLQLEAGGVAVRGSPAKKRQAVRADADRPQQRQSLLRDKLSMLHAAATSPSGNKGVQEPRREKRKLSAVAQGAAGVEVCVGATRMQGLKQGSDAMRTSL
jgi:hypothetical protein